MRGIAIVIPARNEAWRIGNVLGPVIEFKKKSAEKTAIIVVDNGSNDGTGNVVRGIGAREDCDIVIVGENKRGKKSALLAGIAHAVEAKPEIIVTLDADLLNLNAEHVQKLVDGARKRGFAVGVLPHFLRGSSEIIKQFRIEGSGQRAYQTEKLISILNEEKVKKELRRNPAYGLDSFTYTIFGKRFGKPAHVILNGVGHIGKARKNLWFPHIRNAITQAHQAYSKFKAKRI